MKPIHVNVLVLNMKVAKSVEALLPLCIFEFGDAEAGGQRGVVEGSEVTREVEPILHSKEFFGPDTVPWRFKHDADGGGFLRDDVVGGREEFCGVVEK